MRAVLQRGIETMRLVGHGGLDVDLVVHLARTFAYRVTNVICLLSCILVCLMINMIKPTV